jgi:pimeloyl-ACP methyl ester carboxylesterase
MTMPNGAGHLPSLERPAEITNLVAAFIDGCSNRRATR